MRNVMTQCWTFLEYVQNYAVAVSVLDRMLFDHNFASLL